MKFELSFLKNATGGVVFGDERTTFSSVSIDSRNLKEGALFVALKGERTDGHNFLRDALKKANGAMVSKKVNLEKPHILVEDTLKSFHIFAKTIREKLDPFVIAITGSVGKSSLKNLLYLSLSGALKDVEASEGNLNSITGLPLSICNVTSNCKYLILEAGINKRGEMEILSFISEPNLVCFTGIKSVHTKLIPTLEEIAEEKSKLLKYLKEKGKILYPYGDPYLKNKILKYGQEKISFGFGGDIYGEILKDEGFKGMEIEIKLPKKNLNFQIPHGYLHLNSIEISFCIFYLFSLDYNYLIETIKEYKPLKHRLNFFKAKRGFYVIDDTYNSSPSALKELLNKLKKTPTDGKKYLLMGDMLELGEKEEEYHREAGEYAYDIVEAIFCFGKLSKVAGEIFKERGKKFYFFEDYEEGGKIINNILKRGDLIAIKGSRGMEMEKFLPYLEVKNAL